MFQRPSAPDTRKAFWCIREVISLLQCTPEDYMLEEDLEIASRHIVTAQPTPSPSRIYAEAASQTTVLSAPPAPSPPPPSRTYSEEGTQVTPPTRSYAEAATSTTPPPTINRKDKGKQPATGPNAIPASVKKQRTPPPRATTPAKKVKGKEVQVLRPLPKQQRGRHTTTGSSTPENPPPQARTLVMHAAPLMFKPGTMRRWIEEDNKGTKILGICWLLKEDRRGKAASSLVIYLKDKIEVGVLRMGRRLFRTTHYDWNR